MRKHALLLILLLPALAGFAPAWQEIDKAGYPADAPHAGCRGSAFHLDRAGESLPGQSEWELGWYEIEGEFFLDEDMEDGVFAAWVSIHIAKSEETDSLLLDALWNVDVLEVLIDDEPASFHHDGQALLRIDTPDVPVGEEILVQVNYEARENEDGFGAFVFDPYLDYDSVRHPLIYTMTQTQNAGSWWPCIDRLDHRADSMSVKITVPDTLIVASNGSLESIVDLEDARRRYHWMERYSIPSYLVSITISDYWSPNEDGRPFVEMYHFADGDSMPLTLFAFKFHEEQGKAHFEGVTADQLDCFGARFGEYPYRNEKYGFAEYRFSGGMEHMTLSSIGATTIAGEDPINYVLPHEAAHQWFGDQVTCATWEDIWLNEGFATYSEALYYEHVGRWTPGDYLFARRWRESFDGTVYDPNITVGNTTYWKGGWVLHMLRGRCRHHFGENAESYALGESEGDALFFEILRTWAQESPHSFSTGSTEDFIEWSESVSGFELRPFFERWLYDTGRPHYSYSWSAEPEGGDWTAAVAIRQVHQGALFSEPLDLMFRLAGGDSLVATVLPDASDQSYAIELPSEPTELLLDPHHKILHRAVVFEEEFRLQHPHPNPFAAEEGIRIPIILKEDAHVAAAIYDVAGRLVRGLHEGGAEAPLLDLQWNGRDGNGERCVRGIYLLRVETGGEVQTRKLVLLSTD